MSDCAHVLHAGAYMLLQAMQAGKGHTSSPVWAAGRHRFHHHHSGGASLGGFGLPLFVPVSVPASQPEQATAAANDPFLRAETQR